MMRPNREWPPSFSLVLGGPLFQMFRRLHLSGDALELLYRRIMVMSGVAWLPLLLLSAAQGDVASDSVPITFLKDIEAHVRFLIALPMLIAAELVVHVRIQPAVDQFIRRGIVPADQLPQYWEAVESTARLRNSMLVELALISLVYTLGLWVWRNEIALTTASWYANPKGTQMWLKPAGYWYAFVSVPIFQFILLRWYLRFVLWFRFLFRVSRLRLALNASHADRAAGLGFLGVSLGAFALILVAQGALLAAFIAGQVLYAGRDLMSFRMEIVAFLVLLVAVPIIPLILFTPHLIRAKRQAVFQFGPLASRYSNEFQRKWVEGHERADEPLLGSADIQSLADLGNSYSAIRETRLLPVGIGDVVTLAVISALPFLPLLLTTFSLNQFVTYLLKAVF